ncbi:winged helix-turn-helix domain-containing protein [Rubellimicrobium arenae]|uniref:winged helix-turn-helix domain-containing protein n=1 Tax=Rubellimicrobium arenae TaxID=2817372 RepID=UPI001B31115D|nr:winged helix-turn-helix domain-containing protein [Rubellimicrobium arenae]
MAAFVFGDFELDEAAHSLRLKGEELPIQPLVLSLLAYLVRHAGRVVPKDELMDALWPGLHVTEASVQRAVSLARTALKAGGLEGALRNVPRLGYRFALDRATLAEIGPTQSAGMSLALDRARQAAEARRWTEASSRFAEADQVNRLGPEDLDLWAYTLECQGRLNASRPLHARAVEGHLGQGAPYKAARSAVRLGTVNFELGHAEASRAWIARAEELLGSDGPTEVEAFLLWMKSRQAAFDGEPDAALDLIRRAVQLAETSSSIAMRALAIAYEGFYRMTLGDVETGRARQDLAAATALSSEIDPHTGSVIYCSILWSCRMFADWSRAAQWSPGFEFWCSMAYAGITGACRLHGADVLASVGRLAEALREIDIAIPALIEEGTWELGDAYRVRGDIRAMMGEPEAARGDYQLCMSLGWDGEPGLARLVAEAGDVPSALAALDRSLEGGSWHARQRRGWLLANKAQIAAGAGLVEEAAAALAELGGRRDATPIPAIQAMALEAQAELMVHDGQVAAAITTCQLARQLWLGVRHEFHAARLHLRVAELMEQTGDGARAHMERAAARMVAERVGARRLLARLDAMEEAQSSVDAQGALPGWEPEGTIVFDKSRRGVRSSAA